jgi:hypothetical protein
LTDSIIDIFEVVTTRIEDTEPAAIDARRRMGRWSRGRGPHYHLAITYDDDHWGPPAVHGIEQNQRWEYGLIKVKTI